MVESQEGDDIRFVAITTPSKECKVLSGEQRSKRERKTTTIYLRFYWPILESQHC